jgi:hypothetical protein
MATDFYDDVPEKETPHTGQAKSKEGDYITYGAAWAHHSNNVYNGEIPFYSGTIEVDELPKPDSKGKVSFMMFPNLNRRKGTNDPHYYLIPARDK